MQEYDLYLNPQKSSVGLYVHKGAGLPDLVDSRNGCSMAPRRKRTCHRTL